MLSDGRLAVSPCFETVEVVDGPTRKLYLKQAGIGFEFLSDPLSHGIPIKGS